MSSRLAILLCLFVCASPVAAQPASPCGVSPTDWCASPVGDPCGRYKNQGDCRADPLCKGMPYRGESVIACIPDGKGFWENCPAIGCVSR